MAALTWVVFEKTKDSFMGSEIYLQWYSARLLTFEEENPYTSIIPYPDFYPDTVTVPIIPEHLNTPLYSLLVVFPFSLIDKFSAAFIIWLFFSIICVIILLWSTLRLIEWKIKWLIVIVVSTYLGLSFSSFQAFISGSMIIVTSVFLVFSFLALKSGRNEFAGVLLALTSVLPHFYFPIYIIAVIWGISVRRWGYVIWFLAGIFFLIVFGIFVIPGWVIDYARILWKFDVNFPLWTPGEILVNWIPGIGKQLGWGLTFLMSAYLLVEWLAVRGKDIQWYFWTVCLTITASQLIGIAVNLAEHFILAVPIILILSVWVQRTGKSGQRMMIVSVIGLIALPWFLALRTGFNQVILRPSASLFFLLPMVTLIGIFWIRWWAIRPAHLFIEELRSDG